MAALAVLETVTLNPKPAFGFLSFCEKLSLLLGRAHDRRWEGGGVGTSGGLGKLRQPQGVLGSITRRGPLTILAIVKRLETYFRDLITHFRALTTLLVTWGGPPCRGPWIKVKPTG